MKRIIRNIFNRFGYDIVKTGIPYVSKSSKDSVVRVGKFDIMMPGYNIQLANYQIYKDLNASLARLAVCIQIKYPGMTAVDVGANVGDTVAVIKSAVDIPVIAIEGDEVSFSYLKRNCSQFSSVTLICKFLSEATEEKKVSMEKKGWNTTIIPDSGEGAEINFETLDHICQSSDFNNVSIKLLKVDAEGFDTIVLRGARKVIQSHKPVLFFEYNRSNMKVIGEEGLSTILSFGAAGYYKIAFFDHKGTLLLATDLQHTELITWLHDYISSDKNLLGYYDIAIFSETDTDIAEQFLNKEKSQL